MKFDKIAESNIRRKESGRERRLEKIIESYADGEEKNLPIDRIKEYADPDGNTQPYDLEQSKIDALALSISQNGQIEPVIVREKDDYYQLLCGHHRLAALQKIGSSEIYAKIVTCSDWEAYRIMVESNIHHGSPTPSEMSNIIVRYKEKYKDGDSRLTNKDLAELFDISQRQVYRYIAMSSLCDEIRSDIDSGVISTNSVDDITPLPFTQQQVLSEYIAFSEKNLNVSACKKAVSFLLENKNADADMLCEFMSESKKKKKYKNKLYNTLSETEIGEKMSQYSEQELDDIVKSLLDNYFSSLDTQSAEN